MPGCGPPPRAIPAATLTAMTRRPPAITSVTPSDDGVHVAWEVDSFFDGSEEPEKVLISLNGWLRETLDGDETSTTIPQADLTALATQVVTIGVSFWWSGSPPEEQQSVFQLTLAGGPVQGVYPAATPSVRVVRVLPRTSDRPASITIAWQSNNYNDGTIVWGPQSSPTAFRRSIRPRGERYSGEFTTDQILTSGARYVFRVQVRNTLHSPGWVSATITVAVPDSTWSVRTFLIASGKPVTSGLASVLGPARSVRAWLRG
jgi:hypothetical protein